MKRIFYSLYISFFVLSLQTLSFGQSGDSIAEKGNNNRNSGLSTINESRISLYPMPTNGLLNISFGENQVENPKVMVFDILGNLLNTIETDRISSNTFSLDLGEKKPGYYFIKIQGDNGTVSRRITIRE